MTRVLGVSCALLFCLASCGDSASDTDSTSESDSATGSESEGTTAGGEELCVAGNTSVSGTVNGAAVSSSGPRSARLLNQVSDPPSLVLGWDGGSATLQWEGLIGAATPTDVTGIIEVDGVTYCFSSGTLSVDDDGFDRFTVGGLTETDDNDPAMCPGANAATGELEGCSDAD